MIRLNAQKMGHLLSLILLLTGCHSLKTVNDYAKAATTGLAAFDGIKVNFTENYKRSIKRDSVEKHDFRTSPVLPRDLTALFAPGPTITQFQRADTAVNQVVTVLKEYFTGLQNLSNNDLISFDPKFESLGNVLKDSTTLHLTSDQTSAYQKLIKFIGNAALQKYRRKKLTEYIQQSYEPVKVLLGTLKTLTSTMVDEIKGQQSKAFTSYSFQVIHADSSYLTRLNLARDYVHEYDTLSDQINKLTTFARTLTVLQKSHEQVFAERDGWDKKELREAIMANLTELQKLKSDFDKLK